MKTPRIVNAVGYIDDELVTAAENKKIAKRSPWLKWGSIAACFVLIIGAGALILPEVIDGKVGTVSQSETESQEAPSDNAVEGVYIPAIELPDAESAAVMDMLGLVVYQGRIYTQAEYYFGEAAEKIEALVGEHLGTAKGNIDEWSSQDEYSAEFASTVGGEVYSVNGYDTSFRICIYGKYEDENHNHTVWIQFLDCLNGITLKTGAELFQDRLHISERTEAVLLEKQGDENSTEENIPTADIDQNAWSDFWYQADNSEIIRIRNYGAQNNQALLILSMSDGTVIRLRLIEGGYVGYDDLGGYFVKISEETFKAVYDACAGTH